MEWNGWNIQLNMFDLNKILNKIRIELKEVNFMYTCLR